MPSSRPESLNKSSSRPLVSKAVRKHLQVQYDSSDNHSAATSTQQDDDSSDPDSGVFQRQDSRDRPAARKQPTFAAKRSAARKKVKFDGFDDSDDDDDDATVRAGPSQQRVQQSPPAQPAIPRAPPPVGPVKQRGVKNKKARKSFNVDLDDDRNRPVKSTHGTGTDFRRAQVGHWNSKLARKVVESERHYAMSAGQRMPSQTASVFKQDKRRRWFLRGGKIGSRGRHGAHPRRSESDESDEDLYEHPPQRATKVADNPQFASKSVNRPRAFIHESDIEVESDMGYSFQDDDNMVNEPGAEYHTDTSENDEEGALEHTEPSQTLLDSLERFTSSIIQLHKMRRLPFLRRNLQRGFQLHCRMVGIDTKSRPPSRMSISVVYNCPPVDSTSSEPRRIRDATAKSTMKDWMCPLCDLHKKFHNPTMLDKHLSWDHSGVKVLWDSHYTKLSLTIPDSQPETGSDRMRQVSVREWSTSSLSTESKYVERSKSSESDNKFIVRISSTPSGATSEPTSRSVSTLPTSVESEDLKLKRDMSESSDRTGPGSRTRSGSSVSRRSTSQAVPGTDFQDGLGPSAISPFLPDMDEKGDVYYSCRPGGPRVFDLLNPLSLKQFGVLKWVIIDREEELFELDDILDEDKFMQALWFRWKFLNRNKFVANYFDGVKAFVRENWELIKKGAGLSALRLFLLVFVVNNYLLPMEIVPLVQYYQELADIQLRYQ